MSATSARPALTETGEHRVQQAAEYVRRHRWLILAELITAGDDYEIVAAMEASHAGAFEKEAGQHGVTVTAIGEIRDGSGKVEVLDMEGRPLKLERNSYEHFE